MALVSHNERLSMIDTEEEIKWAELIKTKMLAELDEHIVENAPVILDHDVDSMDLLSTAPNLISPMYEKYLALKSRIESMADVTWFIDNREQPLSLLADQNEDKKESDK